jgi:hypothetical protein
MAGVFLVTLSLCDELDRACKSLEESDQQRSDAFLPSQLSEHGSPFNVFNKQSLPGKRLDGGGSGAWDSVGGNGSPFKIFSSK